MDVFPHLALEGHVVLEVEACVCLEHLPRELDIVQIQLCSDRPLVDDYKSPLTHDEVKRYLWPRIQRLKRELDAMLNEDKAYRNRK
jgi:hypothetical protein